MFDFLHANEVPATLLIWGLFGANASTAILPITGRGCVDATSNLRGVRGFGGLSRLLRTGEVKEPIGIQRNAIFANFKMQMRAGSAAGGTQITDELTFEHNIARFDTHFGKVRIACGQAIIVVDIDHLPIFTV